MKCTHAIFGLFLLGATTFAAPPGFVSSPLSDGETVVDEAMRTYGEAIRAENLDTVLEDLEKVYENEEAQPGEREHAAQLSLQILWRHGEIKKAREIANDLAKESPTAQHMWWNACLQEAEGRSQRARKVYEKLVEQHPDSDEASRSRLRLALLPEKKSKKDEPSPLGDWAREQDTLTKNRAAVVLGLIGRGEEALEIVEISGEDRARFRQEIRATEWGLDAEDWDAAKSHAWEAYAFGKIKRNRRYALTLLVEAHRGAGTLSELIDELGTREDLEDEARQVWVALLRETGQVDRALELSQADSDGGFSVEMRRELLEMCREAGREEELVTRYRTWMEAEPEVLEWREGLSRHYLERGEAAAAEQLWREAPAHLATTGQLLLACDVTSGLGLDEFALQFSEMAVERGTEDGVAGGLLFQVALHERRGELPKAIDALARLEGMLRDESPARMDVAEAWERLGQLERAVDTLEGVKAALGGNLAEDLEMRLAWLYSEVEREEEALASWRTLWTRVNSLPRRRYVEDRMMHVAARLGVLADIAVELEKKLIADEADDRDTGLLIRIYTKANDPVSASEVIDEFMGETDQKALIKALQEKARIYLSCTDYYHYEQIVRELIAVDPEGELDYLRQLAMSQLERGKPQEARDVLERLKELEGDKSGSEFEAGVLALAGLEEEAIAIYRKGLIEYPERIESYLLLGKLLKDSGSTTLGLGMFQYLVETAEKDDLFTIAVDGLLNLDAPDDVAQWARRRTLERIATREDKLYLYQLASDMAEQLNNKQEMLRALEAAMPAAREQRSSLLRELMDLTQQGGGGISYMVVNGQLVERERKNPLLAQHLYYGRRLVGLGELIPPQVYLDLGKAFLKNDDVRAATKTYSLLSRVPDAKSYERDVASSLEGAGYVKAALEAYEKILIGEVGDVGLLRKIATLHEKLGNDRIASQQYMRGMQLLLSRKPLASDEKESDEPTDYWSRNRNVDDFDQYGASMFMGWLITADPERANAYWESELAKLEAEYQEITAERDALPEDERRPLDLSQHPRSQARLGWLREAAIKFQAVEVADRADRFALTSYPETEGLLERAVKQRVQRGYVASARGLLKVAEVSEEERTTAELLVGGNVGGGSSKGVLPASEVAGLLLPLWVADRPDDLDAVLARINLNQVRGEDLQAMQAMMSSQLVLADGSRTLELVRHWIRVAMADESLPWKNGEYMKIVERGRKMLPPDKFRSLLDFMVDLLDEDFAKRSDLFDIVVTESRGLEPPLISEERAKDWAEKLAETQPYYVSRILEFLPDFERGPVLKKAWAKIPKTTRGYLIFNIINEQKGTQPENFIGVLASLLEEALKDDQARQNASYYVDELFSEDRDPKLVRAITNVVVRVAPEMEGIDLMRAKWLAEQEAWDEVDAMVDGIFRDWLDDVNVSDWNAREARDWILGRSWKREPERLTKVYETWEAEEKRSESTVLRWIKWLSQVGDLEAMRIAVDAGREEFPEDEDLKNQHVALLDREGKRAEAMAARLAELEEDAENKGLIQRLINRYRGMNDPAAAKELQERLDALNEKDKKEVPKPAVADSDEPIPEKQEKAEMKGVKEAWDDERYADAASTFRRLWRTWPSENSRMFGFPMMSIGGFGGSSRNNVPYPWPKDEEEKAEEDDEKPKPAPTKGGLTAFKEVIEKKPEDEADRDEEKPRSAYDILPERPEGEAEIRRMLRSLTPAALDRSQALFDGLATVTAARSTPAEAIEAGISDLRGGRAGKEAASVLLTLCERHPDAVGDEIGALLDDLVRTVHPLDGGQLRRMSRILARIGRTEEAARMYEWCGTLCTTDRYGFSNQETFPAIPRHELVKEIAEELEDGDAKIEVIRRVLGWTKSTPDRWNNTVDSYIVFALDTWKDIVGEERFFEFAEPLLPDVYDLSSGVNRRSAKRFVLPLAKAGRIEEAIRCLDLALCEQDMTQSTLEDPQWSNYDDQGSFNDNDLRAWLPPNWEGFEKPLAWCSALSRALPKWIEEERYYASRGLRILYLSSLRQHELGDVEGAHATWDVANKIADEPEKGSWSRRWNRFGEKKAKRNSSDDLWLADVARRSGRESTAIAIERRLFDERKLHVERIPDLLAKVADEEGLDQAWTFALEQAEFSRHPRLMEVVIDLAKRREDTEAVAEWTATHEAAEAAREWWKAWQEEKQKKRLGR